jgi:type II secretory pathway component GspD/PulD (secretin)
LRRTFSTAGGKLKARRGLVACPTILLLAASLGVADDLASRLYKEGEKAERAGDTFHAYLLYARAVALEPANIQFQTRKNALGTAAARKTAWTTADSSVEDQLASGELSPAEISDLRDALPSPQLKPSSVKANFDLRGKAEDIVEKVAAAYGLHLEIESGYQAPPNFVFRTGELGMEEALRTLEQVANSLIVPINGSTVLLVRDNPTRRTDTLAVISKAIPIPERLSVQDAQEILTAVQQTLEIRRIVADPGRHMVYVRDTVSKVTAARQLFADLSRLRAQVEVEVELLEVDKHSALNIGVNLPAATELDYFGSFARNIPSVSGMFTKFLTFGGGKTLFGIGVSSAAAIATLSRSSVEALVDAEIVTVDGQPGSMTIGDHYPIPANQYIGPTGGQGTVYVPPPQINYVDLGLTMKVTPNVHDGGEMTLDIDAQYNVLGTGGANGIPDVNQRRYQGKVRLRKNEWIVIAGLTQEIHAVSKKGIAWLADLPLIGHLFRQDTKTDDDTQFLVLLKPHIVNLPPWEYPTQKLWVGTEGKSLPLY